MDNIEFLTDNTVEVLQSDKNKKFRNGLQMQIIRSFDNKLSKINGNEIEKQLCCSNVQDTNYNWHYIIPPSKNINKIQKIIDEIQPEFPEVDLSIYKCEGNIPISLYDDFNYNVNDDLILPFFNSNLRQSNIEFPYKKYLKGEEKANYCASYIHFLYQLFANFYVDKKITPTFDNLNSTADNFIEEYKEKIINGFKRNMYVYVFLNDKSIITSFPTNALVYEDVDYKYISEYVVKFFSTPDKFHYLLNYYIKATEDCPIHVLTALYKNKKYRLQPYLIHHFIRASFSSEFDEFFDQYFLIKSKYPQLYFWNIIFLCMFKFSYYYYYWLTSQRFFRFTTKFEMNNLLNNYNRNSSFDFFLNNFETKISEDNLNKYIKLYEEEKFDILIKEIFPNNIFYVVPTKSFKRRSNNFNLLHAYKVLEEKEDYYTIRGDNYITRKYSKKSFQVT